MPYRTLSRLVNYKYLIFIFFIFIDHTYAEELIISKYQYGLYKGNIHFGSSEQTLLKNGPIYKFNIKSTSAGIFKLKKDDRLETTSFIKENNMIKPISYKFIKEKKNSSQLIETIFNLDNSYAYTIENNNKQEHINIPYSLDRLSVQIDFQEKMKTGVFEYKYNIIDKGRLRKYSFVLHSDAIIDTVFGETNTIVIKKLIENNKRSTLTWYAVDYDFIPVKIEQYRKEALVFTVILNEVYK
tara:strand:- start:463 stop:1185 length:723 start_codon:yes stop_codon:yes gene_type:complete